MLEYLSNHREFCDFDQLESIKKDRAQWIERPSAKEYKDAQSLIPSIRAKHQDFAVPSVTLGKEEELSEEQHEELMNCLKAMMPWKKGPFNLFGIDVDAEWRSDLKWERLEKFLDPLDGHRVMDIGCHNGYFMFRMLAHNPKLVIGIDPVLPCQIQFDLMNQLAGDDRLKFELFGVEHLKHFKGYFDTIFSMGIIYHHRHPMEQMIDIRNALVPGGQAIIETIGIPGEGSYALFPEDRYAKMRNVWFVPTLECFINWAKRAQFVDVEVVAATPLTFEEQRNTKWCPPPHQTLCDFLDSEDLSKTVEGHPAPMRFCLKVKKKRGVGNFRKPQDEA